jgi:hypothetical protein
MSAISDTLTIGLVLILVFGSACLYLYTRIQQSETKINLLESILLDLKMTNELKAYPNIPVYSGADLVEAYTEHLPSHVEDLSHSIVKPFTDEDEDLVELPATVESGVKMAPNYEAMTAKELHSLAKQRGLPGTSAFRRIQLIEALKQSDSRHVNILESLISDSSSANDSGLASSAEEISVNP